MTSLPGLTRLVALLGCLATAPAGLAGDVGRELGYPSRKPWYERPDTHATAARLAERSAAERRALARLEGTDRHRRRSDRRSDHKPHSSDAFRQGPGSADRSTALLRQSRDPAPAWQERWTPWGYAPNYYGLGGSQRYIHRDARRYGYRGGYTVVVPSYGYRNDGRHYGGRHHYGRRHYGGRDYGYGYGGRRYGKSYGYGHQRRHHYREPRSRLGN